MKDAKDSKEIEVRSGLSCDDSSDRRSTKATCAVKSVCKTSGRLSDGIDRRTTDPLQIPAIYQSDEIEAEDSEIQDCELPNRSDRLAQGAGIVTDGGDAKEEDPHSTSLYYHEGGELFAKDVEQHLSVLPEGATSSTEITIDNVQVGDPVVPLPEDQ